MLSYQCEVDPDPDIERLKAEVLESRQRGEVLFSVKRIKTNRPISDKEMADSFVAELGCIGLGSHWLEIDRQEAVWVLTRVLWADLCWNASMMTRDEAFDLAARFMNLFGESAYFTNGTWRKRVIPLPDPVDYLEGFWPITQASSDAGVVVVSADRIGMLWVKDED